ncbi:receptor-type tyrosine-protein phosphatase-like [Dreissena polymorpha]|uniref:receptor-type tyrosine-protein phosphatase-like n=1 Tax=Dreissena polymorpha TaxID=45954 RepID=UPI0022655566|nr:receptor-type tyrosine-protein phosphatase-like [Dreissena polymorpha]
MNLVISVQESACRRPVVLQCRDGYSQSGLFTVLWCLVERCQRDGEVAVAETVKMIRRRRKQVLTNEAQYRFCHQFMKEYIEGSLVYVYEQIKLP